MHLGWLRCGSGTYPQYASSSRLASRAPRTRSATDFATRPSVKITRHGVNVAARDVQPRQRAHDQVDHGCVTTARQIRAVSEHLAFDDAVSEQDRGVPRG